MTWSKAMWIFFLVSNKVSSVSYFHSSSADWCRPTSSKWRDLENWWKASDSEYIHSTCNKKKKKLQGQWIKLGFVFHSQSTFIYVGAMQILEYHAVFNILRPHMLTYTCNAIALFPVRGIMSFWQLNCVILSKEHLFSLSVFWGHFCPSPDRK